MMTSKSRELRAAELAAVAAEQAEFNRTKLPWQVLFQLARANEFGLSYTVSRGANDDSVIVTLEAETNNLGYNDNESITVYRDPTPCCFTPEYNLQSFESLVNSVESYKSEQQRKAEVKRAALDKLTAEEKQVLGLLPMGYIR
jgi:hypothetical protein